MNLKRRIEVAQNRAQALLSSSPEAWVEVPWPGGGVIRFPSSPAFDAALAKVYGDPEPSPAE